jgi:hypothetical protein
MNSAVLASGYGEIVVQKRQRLGAVEVAFASGRSLRVSNFLGAYVDPGDEIKFALPSGRDVLANPELLIKRGTGAYVYQASVGYAAKPKTDHLRHPYVQAEVAGAMLGFKVLHLTCAALRDYFYTPPRNYNPGSLNFYDVLRTSHNASPGASRTRLSQVERTQLSNQEPKLK